MIGRSIWHASGTTRLHERSSAANGRVRSRGDGGDRYQSGAARFSAWQSRSDARQDGLSEYDQRRPLTPTGTNLLGLVKHLTGLEYGYFGDSFGRPSVERPTWFRDDPYTEIDMWATR